MIVVTSGKKYIDIDAYASCIAYAKLLNLKGLEAKTASTAKLNESITTSLKKFNMGWDNYVPNEDDRYIVIDVSNKDYFDTFIKEENIIEIIDHHPGFEEYWTNKLKERANIESLGSVATVIFELYEKENLVNEITKDIAILLMAAILDNTLNFKAKITNERDIIAYKKLEAISNENNYSEKYFRECQMEVEQDLKASIENDTKIENINEVLPPIFSQLVIWDKDNILKNINIIYDTLDQIGQKWMMNLISLKDGKSYLIAKNPEVQENMSNLFKTKFSNNISELEEVWLRKEIIKLTI